MDIQTVQAIGQVLAWSTVLVGYVIMAMFFYFLLKKWGLYYRKANYGFSQ